MPAPDSADADTRSTGPTKGDDVTVVNESAALADNGNVMDDGLQRGLESRHLVSTHSPRRCWPSTVSMS